MVIASEQLTLPVWLRLRLERIIRKPTKLMGTTHLTRKIQRFAYVQCIRTRSVVKDRMLSFIPLPAPTASDSEAKIKDENRKT